MAGTRRIATRRRGSEVRSVAGVAHEAGHGGYLPQPEREYVNAILWDFCRSELTACLAVAGH